MTNTSIEHDLFIEWMNWLKDNHPEHGFMYDGIVCKQEWDKAEKRILFVLKDYNEKGVYTTLDKVDLNDKECIKHNIFNLRYYLQKGIEAPKNWRVWDNVARWSFGLNHINADQYLPFDKVDYQGDSKHRSSNLKTIAVLDLKKKPGKSSCNKSDLIKYFKEYPENEGFIARQLSLYGILDFVICCGDGVFEIFKDITKKETIRDIYEIAIRRTNYFVTKHGTVVIKYRHPLLLKKGIHKDKAYKTLMELVGKAICDRNKVLDSVKQ